MPEPRARRTFVPVAAGGIAAAGGVAWASNHSWFRVRTDEGLAQVASTALASGATVPLGTSLALVVLAAWGVILVARGRARRLASALGFLASGWLVVVVVHAAATGRHDVTQELARLGVSGEADRTIWPWLAIVASGVSLATGLAAVLLCPAWPEMSHRYDAPAGGSVPAGAISDPDGAHNRDLWRAIDEGRDPTDGRT